MAFESLLGNEQLKQNLTKSLEKGHISHFYLISGPEGSGKHTLAGLLASAIFCRGRNRPCGVCEACRKIQSGNHPDFITVADPDKKTVPVELVRRYRDDMFIRPNESDHKIYLFPQELRTEGQNALLKILEEPPQYGVFILLTDNPEKLLPTVRSRCTELKMQALPEAVLLPRLRQAHPQADRETLTAAAQRSGGYLGQALALLEDGAELPPQTPELIKALCTRDALLLTQTLVPMEKWKRDALGQILQSWLTLAESALACRSGIQALSPLARQLSAARTAPELYQIVRALKKAADLTAANVSPAAICGWLVWALR